MRYVVNGKEVSPEEFYRHHKTPEWLQTRRMITANTYRQHDPLMSDGIGCMKSQVPEMRETIRKHNIKGVTVQDSGRLEITSRRGRRDLLRVRGLQDSDAGYGDAY
jgi:predicted SnoaL-like aldol condensation-catalyzing enzyme